MTNVVSKTISLKEVLEFYTEQIRKDTGVDGILVGPAKGSTFDLNSQVRFAWDVDSREVTEAPKATEKKAGRPKKEKS